MSIFNDVIQNHEQEQQAINARKAEESARITAEIELFIDKVKLGYSAIIIPLFEEFVRDASEYGFAAKLGEYEQTSEHYYISLKIIPEKGSSFGTNASAESVFAVKAALSSQKVHYVSYYDQRIGVQNGVARSEYGWQSINREQLEKQLKNFLTLAVKSRL